MNTNEVILSIVSFFLTMLLVTVIFPILETVIYKKLGKNYLCKWLYKNYKLSDFSLFKLDCICLYLNIDKKEILISGIHELFEENYNG